jgi:endo-1,4-beta-xylanase
VTYKKANKAGGEKISIDAKTGKLTAKKGLKKGTYKVKVKLSAPASATYKAAKVKEITVKVVVK